jgi:hypothetical protein
MIRYTAFGLFFRLELVDPPAKEFVDNAGPIGPAGVRL